MSGYYRFPALCGIDLVFVSEDDLWAVSAEGGVARRLTANLGAISHPTISPDCKTIAFTGRDEGAAEVYLMESRGGPVRRLTYLGANSMVAGWTPDGSRILFSSDAGQPFGVGIIQSVTQNGDTPEIWPVGPALAISINDKNQTVIGRNNNDPARWKRYRGGTAGELWIDAAGDGQFKRLIVLNGNMARPMWLGERVFFISDHEGTGNIYSCTPNGSDLKRHTHHTDYYARFPSTDGKRIVYHAGADIYLYDPATDASTKVEIAYYSPRVQAQRKFAEPARYFESYDPNPEGYAVALNARGRSFTFGNWEGAVIQQGGEGNTSRRRLTRWLKDGNRVVTVTDTGDGDSLEIHSTNELTAPVLLNTLDLGRPSELKVSPEDDAVLLSNHRNELILVDLAAKTAKVVARSEAGLIRGFDWSPDGRWVAFGYAETPYTSAIMLWNRETGETHRITEPILNDYNPGFDSEGKYLYFLGKRELNPVYDNLHFDLGFPRGIKPYLITLQSDAPSPFMPVPRPLKPAPKPDEKNGKKNGEQSEGDEKPAKEPIEIDLDGIENRILPFPVPEGIYGRIAGLKGKAIFTSFPVEGALHMDWMPGEAEAKGTLEVFDFETQKHEPLVNAVTDFELSANRSTLFYRSGNKLRAINAGVKPDEKTSGEGPGRISGWIDINRARILIEPQVEWRQMAREAWQLQREFFWTPDMSNVDWNNVWDRYSALLERVGTRGEFSDLMWEMQGELGTSHAYEFGGDYKVPPAYPLGFLGADMEWDKTTGVWRVARILRGAPGEPNASSPLNAPGVNVKVGDAIVAVNGKRMTVDVQPLQYLLHHAGVEIVITIQSADGSTRDATVKTLKEERSVRYREWVEANRRLVHEKTGGRVGYVHVPDMGARGYAEFHRLYLAEVCREAMIVDVRNNGGGHVSQLIIEKLARRQVGFDVPRWGRPEPYPNYSVAGPIVALTNQWAGSDGDIFSHVFKLKKLGTLIGKRTWGGVIGIWPRNPLADGSITTQPEFSFWFQDVGWGVENYGTDPDIDVDITPQDYASGRDPQMEKALEVVMAQLEANPPVKPDFTIRPSRIVPPLPNIS